jgi:hypothetical protein
MFAMPARVRFFAYLANGLRFPLDTSRAPDLTAPRQIGHCGTVPTPQEGRGEYASVRAQCKLRPNTGGAAMLRKSNTVGRSDPKSSQSLDDWMYAVALIILRRQMRGKWVDSLSSSGPTAAA